MEKSKDFSTEVIRSQNNQLEIEKESRRLEKLFYFYRDVEQFISREKIESSLTSFRAENTILHNDVISLVENSDSKFLRRLDHIWGKFLVKKSN